MRTTQIMAATLIVGSGLAHFAQAQKPAIGRTALTHRDIAAQCMARLYLAALANGLSTDRVSMWPRLAL